MWGLGFLITNEATPGLRSARSLRWGGLNNTYFWLDPARGVAGVILMQFPPFADPRALAVYGDFERAVYQTQSSSQKPGAKGPAYEGWTPPRTPDGRPDLQGVWNYAAGTPLERPSAYAGREFLTDDELAQCLAFASLATELLIDGPGSTVNGHLDPDLLNALKLRTEVYQAQGMVTVQLDITLGAALARMRARAFALGVELGQLSADIVAGRTRFTNDEGGSS